MTKRQPIWETGKLTVHLVFELLAYTSELHRYNVSKLLEVFYCRELADRTKQNNKPDVIINYTNPGLCHSELARDGPLILHIVKFFLARTTEVGSRTLVNAVETGPESHGQYMSCSRVGM